MAVRGIGQTTRGSSDIVFTFADGSSLPLKLYRDKDHRIHIRRQTTTAEEGQQPRYKEAAKVYRSFRRGAGYEVADDENEGGYGYGSFVTTWTKNMIGPAGYWEEMALPVGVVTRFNRSFEMAGSLWYTCLNQFMLKVDSLIGPCFNAGVTMVSAQSQDVAIFKDKAWVANGGAARIWSFDGTSWVQATDDVRRSRFAVTNMAVGPQMSGTPLTSGSSYRLLFGSDAGNGLYHCAGNPGLSADWVGPNAVGDSVYSIQGLNATSEAVFARKPEGIYLVLGGGRMPNLSPWWRDQYDPSNGGYGEFYDGFFFGGTTHVLDMISPDPSNLGLQQECQPGANESVERSPIFGRPNAMTRIDGWLYVAFYNGARSYVMRGKRADRLGVRNRNPMIWYGPEFECDGNILDIRCVSPANTALPRYIYYAVNDASNLPHLYRQHLPREASPYAAVRAGTGWRAAEAWSITMSAEDFGDPDAPKVMRFFGGVGEGLGDTYPGNTVTISTVTDDDTSSVQQAILTAHRDYAVADTASARGHRITVTASVENDSAHPVWLRAVKMRGTVNDEKIATLLVPVELGRGERGVDPMETRDARQLAERLYSILEVGPIDLHDWMGRDVEVVMEDIEESEVEDVHGNGGVIRVATLTLSVMLVKARYGSSVYGGGRYA